MSLFGKQLNKSAKSKATKNSTLDLGKELTALKEKIEKADDNNDDRQIELFCFAIDSRRVDDDSRSHSVVKMIHARGGTISRQLDIIAKALLDDELGKK